jgi:CRP-like cAMP-binding protein
MGTTDTTTRLRIRHARETLLRAGVLDGAKNTRVTVRVQDRLLEAARRRTGISGESDLVTAGLALLAAQEDFGAWLVGQRGTLSDDFEIGL